jgi:hypothetical protein
VGEPGLPGGLPGGVLGVVGSPGGRLGEAGGACAIARFAAITSANMERGNFLFIKDILRERIELMQAAVRVSEMTR